MTISLHRCKRCGKDISYRSLQARYCEDCAVVQEKIRASERSARFRERHREKLRQKSKQWALDHPEQHKRIVQKYCAIHAVSLYAGLKEWRKNNPEKYKAQHKRNNARRQERILKQRRRKRRAPPGEGNFYMPRTKELIVAGECIDCHAIVLASQRGPVKWYCDTCKAARLKQQTKKYSQKFKREHPAANTVWYRLKRNNGEIVVGGECIRCGCFMLFAERGMRRQRCKICAPIAEANACLRRYHEHKKKVLSTEEFIASEKRRLRLDQPKEKWTPQRIQWEFQRHGKKHHASVGVAEE